MFNALRGLLAPTGGIRLESRLSFRGKLAEDDSELVSSLIGEMPGRNALPDGRGPGESPRL
jgi:hypothetical protein